MLAKEIEKIIQIYTNNNNLEKQNFGEAAEEIAERLELDKEKIYKLIDIYLGDPDVPDKYNKDFEELTKAIIKQKPIRVKEIK